MIKFFLTGSNAFRIYVQYVRRLVEKTDNNAIHKYFAVVERGDKSGRLHIHILHLMSHMPFGVIDPNANMSAPTRRELSLLKLGWKYGISAPMFVVYPGCAWTEKAGFRWPVKKTGSHFKRVTGSVGSVVGYMTKYLTKQDKDPAGEYKWRTRMSRNLGIDRLIPFIEKMQDQELMTLSLFPSSILPKSPIPLKLFQRLAKIILARRLKSLVTVMDIPSPINFWTRLNSMTHPQMNHNSVSIGLFETANTNFTDIYDKCHEHYLTCLQGSGILHFEHFDTSSSFQPRAVAGNDI